MLPGPWRHRDIAANGIRFHVAVGEGFAPIRPLVLLLHGFADFWWTWRDQLPALDAAGLSVAALDLRGYGSSDKPPYGYDARTTAGDVSGVVKSLGFPSAVLVGHDWGGLAAWATTVYAPDTVRALAVVAAPHPLAFPWRHQGASLAFAQLPWWPERRLAARTPGPALGGWPGPRCALQYQRSFLRSRLRAQGRDYRRRLRTPARMPVLSIHGDQDRQVPLSAMTAAERWLAAPNQVVQLPGVGHRPHEEAAESVTGALLTWLNRLPTASG